MPLIDKTELTTKFKAKSHYEFPRALQTISLTVTHPQHGNVATLEALRIVRNACRGEFYDIMDAESDELLQLSTMLFDKHGRVHPWIVQPGARSGSGCWGRELDEGMLISLPDITVKEEFRGQGIGSWALTRFLESEHIAAQDKVICWPAPTGIRDHAAFETAKTRLTSFFRKHNFRRIGRTQFFGYSPKADHPSRGISADEDAAIADAQMAEPVDIDPEEAQTRFPLHAAIVNDSGDQIAAKIQALYDADPTIIHALDVGGCSPLHVAAQVKNLVAVRKLLEWDMTADLTRVATSTGVTPLEALETSMRSSRSFAETLLGQWPGYASEELTIQYLLKQRMGQVVDANLDSYIAKSKYGCTCGSCGGGWMSPRMRFHLNCQAALSRDMMPDFYDSFKRGQPADVGYLFDNASSYIPRHLYPSYYISFYKGYRDVFNAAYLLLETTDELLSANAIQRFLSRDSTFYFNKGGCIEYAFDAITAIAKEQSVEFGDGTHEETFGDDEKWVALPKCVNDIEFDLVRRMLGLSSAERWGPYDYGCEEDEFGGMDDDSEDDDF
ncbi:Ankyrin repeat family protein [Mycena kentingensis (nom. inval.)]|nr:Ankyrin repeat family protein [Mycena kentingensis (nom. inval.)]